VNDTKKFKESIPVAKRLHELFPKLHELYAERNPLSAELHSIKNSMEEKEAEIEKIRQQLTVD
jgi:predicted nuclease with TOPRIM domain